MYILIIGLLFCYCSAFVTHNTRASQEDRDMDTMRFPPDPSVMCTIMYKPEDIRLNNFTTRAARRKLFR